MGEWLSAREIAKKLGINRGTIATNANKHNLEIRKSSYHDVQYNLSDIKRILTTAPPNQFNKHYLVASDTKLYNKYLKLNWDEFIACSDVHSPFVNEKIFNQMLDIGLKYKIKNFIHGGDFWDQLQFSRFDTDPTDMTRFDMDVDYTRKVVKSLLEVFTNVYFILGSHDVRFWMMMLRLNKATSFDEIWGLLDTDKAKRDITSRIHVNSYRFCFIGDEWEVIHPKNVVRIGGIPAVRIVAKRNRSLIIAHGHWWGIEQDPSSKHYLIYPGCMVNGDKVAYKSLWETSHAEWKGGFVAVFDKTTPILFDDKLAKFHLKR